MGAINLEFTSLVSILCSA